MCDLIAHEIAHVLQWASGWDIDRMDPFECEEQADWLVFNWGFSVDAMDEWDLANGVVQPIDLSKMDETERPGVAEEQLKLAFKSGG